MLLPVGLLLLSRRRGRDLVAAGIALLVVPVVTTLAWGPGNVWEQSIQYNRGAERLTSYWGAFTKVVRTLVERDLLLLIVAGLAVVVALVARIRSTPTTGTAAVERPPIVFRPVTILAAWLAAQLAVLVIEPAMWRPHVAHLVVPIALLAVLRPPPLLPVLLAAVLVLPWYYDHLQPMLRPGGFDRAEATAVARARAPPRRRPRHQRQPGARLAVGAPHPGRVRRLVDQAHREGPDRRAEAARAWRGHPTCAPCWCGPTATATCDLGPRLEHEGYVRSSRPGGPYDLYERSACRA